MDEILQTMLDQIDTLSTIEGSYTHTLLSAVSYRIQNALEQVKAANYACHITTAVGEDLDAHAVDYGFSRKEGTLASGTVSFTGSSSATIPSGTVILVQNKRYLTDAEGSVETQIQITAEQSGSDYNQSQSETAVLLSGLDGIAGVQLQTDITGGTDAETDDALRSRLLEFLQNPPTSGNMAHYIMWAQEVAGVGKAICIPVWNGAGTVKVICIDEDGNPISEEIRQTVEAHIEAVRPIGGTLTVAAATAVPITVQAIITGNYQQSVLEDAIKTYLKTLAMTDTVVSPAKIGYLILSVDGISDYQSLTLNGTTDAVAITYDEVPVLEGVTNLA